MADSPLYTFLGSGVATPAVPGSRIRKWTNESLTLTRHTLTNEAHQWLWTVTMQVDKGDRRLGARLLTHMARHEDGTPFDFPMMQHIGVVVPEVSIAVTANAAAASGSMNIRKRTVGDITLETGTYFRLDGQEKVYSVEDDVILKGENTLPMKVFPSLRNAVVPNTALLFQSMMRVRYSEAPVELRYTQGRLLRSATFTVEEAV